MKKISIAILSPGDMGHAVGQALLKSGHKVYTCLAGRSERSHILSEKAGIKNLPILTELIRNVDLVLSILPPDKAVGLADKVADEIKETKTCPVFVDCNAVSPATVQVIAKKIESAGATFIDSGIIGLAPGKESGFGPRFYVSGPDTAILSKIDGCGLKIVPIGKEIGKASGIKMCYAALTKGAMTLQTAALLTAENLCLSDEFVSELAYSQREVLNQMENRVPRLPADSKRWEAEMYQIAETFRDAGVTSRFHEGAAEIFSLLGSTPFAEETRETLDMNRGLSEAVKIYVQSLNKR